MKDILITTQNIKLKAKEEAAFQITYSYAAQPRVAIATDLTYLSFIIAVLNTEIWHCS